MHSLYLPGQLCNRPHSLETRGESLQEATRLCRLDRLTIVQKGPRPETAVSRRRQFRMDRQIRRGRLLLRYSRDTDG